MRKFKGRQGGGDEEPGEGPVPTLQIHHAKGPTLPAEPHPSEMILLAEQEAQRDQASGAYDEIYYLSREGQLPFEDKVDATTRRLQQHARQRGEDAALLGTSQIEHVRAHGVRRRGFVQLHQQLKAGTDNLATLRDRRDEHVAVLEGKAEDGSGRNRTGPVPTATHVLTWLVQAHLLTAVLVTLEGVALYAVFGFVMKTDGTAEIWQHPELMALGAIGAIVTIAVPIVLGVMLRGVHRNHDHAPLFSLGRIVLFVTILVLWVAAVWFMSVARAAEAAAVTKRSASLGDQDVKTDPAVVVTVDPAQLLLVVFLLLGLITMFQVSRHNWHAAEVVKCNALEKKALSEMYALQGDLAQTRAQVIIQSEALAADRRSWTHHIEATLPAIGEDVKEHYRTELVRLSGDPNVTGAVGTTGAVQSANELAEALPASGQFRGEDLESD